MSNCLLQMCTFASMAKQLKIGFDAKRVFQNFTGLGNFSRTLLNDLSKADSALDLHLFAPKKIETQRTAPFLQPPFQTFFPDTIFRSAWRTRSMVKDLIKEKVNVYHGLSHELPLGIEKTNIASVVSMHDLIIKADKKQFKWLDRKIYDLKFKSSCERADKIVAISQSTKSDIIEHYRVSEDKIQVIYQTCHHQFKEEVNRKEVAKYLASKNLPTEYLLYVGSAIPRKNLFRLVKAINQLPKTLRVPLFVVAGKSKYRDKVLEYATKKKIDNLLFFMDDLEFTDLPKLYRGALATVYPSHYEGFGLPIVESLFCHTPVLTGNNSSLPEAGGPGALLIDSKSTVEITRGLQKLLEDEALRKSLSHAGHQYVQQFHSENIIKQWISLYQELAASK